MRLKAAHITNYKCIEDSGEFSLGPVTCLVGKNESGKTALLEVLYKLNPHVKERANFDHQQEYPRRHLSDYENTDEPATVVSTKWSLDEHEMAAVCEVLGPGSMKDPEVTVKRGYDNTNYWTIQVDEPKVVKHLISSSSLHTEEAEEVNKFTTIKELKAHLEALGDSASERHKELLAILKKHFARGTATLAAIDLLAKRMPKFLYFSQYDRMSGQVALEALIKRKADNQLTSEDRVFLAFLGLVGTSVEDLSQTKQFEPLIAKLEAVSNKISRDIFEYWSQNRHLKVQFRLDAALPNDPPPYDKGWIMRTRIYNAHHEVTVSFDERSTGFVWFFSFLVLFSQVKKIHGDNLIILLDEPGLSLHAKAQADLLRYINEKLRPHHQVVYTTHSPFMIPPDDLMSARTVEDVAVERDGNIQILGTKVGDRVLSTDRDTLFPLQSALGYEITQSLFVGEHTLLVEGPSDYLYLKVFSDELKSRGRTYLDPRWVICPTGGIEKVSAFMILFGGNRLHVAVLVDFAKGQKKRVDELRRSKLLRDGHVLSAEMYAGQDEADTEDLLGRATYMALVNQTYGLKDGTQLDLTRSVAKAGRVLKDVEEHFATLPVGASEFDHFRPAAYLLENRSDVLHSLPELEPALDRFEKLFADLNALLAGELRPAVRAMAGSR
jgi:predicted ATPase